MSLNNWLLLWCNNISIAATEMYRKMHECESCLLFVICLLFLAMVWFVLLLLIFYHPFCFSFWFCLCLICKFQCIKGLSRNAQLIHSHFIDSFFTKDKLNYLPLCVCTQIFIVLVISFNTLLDHLANKAFWAFVITWRPLSFAKCYQALPECSLGYLVPKLFLGI